MREFLNHTKCPADFVKHVSSARDLHAPGFFGLEGMRLFGRAAGETSPKYAEQLKNLESSLIRTNGSVQLPFDPDEVIDNLRLEKYVGAVNSSIDYVSNKSLLRQTYYTLRPLFPVPIRRIFQRVALQDWSKIPFPSWPVDTSVEDLMSWLWVRVLESSGEPRIPFIWFWPREYRSCAIMTHDVETEAGQQFCTTLLDIEREHGIRSSFELVPEIRYQIDNHIMNAIREAGCEICVHGLNHDGRLFWSEQEFRTRAKTINQYAQAWGAKGFRSPVMYRNLNWYDAFDFSYDMSVPNVAHLDPQRGGCCTIFPFFVGGILELPLTTIQDYPLYTILQSDPLAMWKRQLEAIVAKCGLASFIIHPDYTIRKSSQEIYRKLLGMLKAYADTQNLWLALPGEVDAWWRTRNELTLVKTNGTWSIQGKGSENGTIAYATLRDGKLTYLFSDERTDHVAALN